MQFYSATGFQSVNANLCWEFRQIHYSIDNMMRKFSFPFCLQIAMAAVFLFLPLQAEDFHEFTNAKGQTVSAKILAVEDSGQLTIQSKEGKKFTVDPSIFSESDRKYIRDWMAAQSTPNADSGKEVFVAVGYGGRRMISEDEGKTWTITEEWMENGKDDKYNIMALAYAQGKFVCAGGGGGGQTAGGHIHVSTDGKTWKQVMDAKNRVNPIIYGNGRFIVGGPNRQQLMWSEDGENWHEGGIIEDRKATHWRNAAFGNDVFVFTGNNGGNSPPWIVTTKDGTSIDSFFDDVPSIRGIAFGNGRFVAVGMEGVRRSSADGVTWEKQDVPGMNISWVSFDGEQFLCGTKPVSVSKDGVNWSDAPDLKLNGVKWTDGKRFITHGWPGKMSFSHDGGKTVEKANPMTPNGINKVVRGFVNP